MHRNVPYVQRRQIHRVALNTYFVISTHLDAADANESEVALHLLKLIGVLEIAIILWVGPLSEAVEAPQSISVLEIGNSDKSKQGDPFRSAGKVSPRAGNVPRRHPHAEATIQYATTSELTTENDETVRNMCGPTTRRTTAAHVVNTA